MSNQLIGIQQVRRWLLSKSGFDSLKIIEVLYSKGLYAQCKKLVLKTKKTAYEYEKFTKIIDLFAWEKKLYAKERYVSVSDSDLDLIYSQEQLIGDKLKNLSEYNARSSKLFIIGDQQGTVVRRKKDNKKINSIIQHPLFRDEKQALSYEANFYFYNANFAFSRLSRDSSGGYKNIKALIAHLESDPIKLQEHMERYIVSINNLLITCWDLGDKEEDINTMMDKLRALYLKQNKHQALQLNIFLTLFKNEIYMAEIKGDFEKVDALAIDLEKGISRLEKIISKYDIFVFCFTVARMYFIVGHHILADKWLNKILTDFEPNIREDIQSFGRILELIILFEKGDTDVLKRKLKSTSQLLKKQNKLLKFEKLIINFITNKLSTDEKWKNRKQEIEEFREFKTLLIKFFKNPKEAKVLDYFDFIAWTESKIERRSLLEVMKEKIKSQRLSPQRSD